MNTPENASIRTKDHRFIVHAPFSAKDALKSLLGRKWSKAKKAWTYPATSTSAAKLVKVLRQCGLTVQLDDAAQRLLHIWGSAAALLRNEALAPTIQGRTTTPRRHQEVAAQLINTRDGILLHHDTGTGKSYTTILAAEIGGHKLILVVAPVAVVEVWPEQYLKHGIGSHTVLTLTGSTSLRCKHLEAAMRHSKPLIVVTNYEGVWRGDFGELILAQKWDMIVADEIHKIKGNNGRASKYFAALANSTPRRVGLTGTPIPNNPLDLFGAFRFLDAGLFGESFAQFRNRFCYMGGFQGKQVMGFREQQTMKAMVASATHRVHKEHVPLSHTRLPVILSKKSRNIYDAIEGSFVAKIASGEITIANALVELLRLQQITGGAVQLDDRDTLMEIGTEKEDVLRTYIEGLPESEPVVVFCRFRNDLARVKRIAKDLDRTAYEVSGAAKQRKEWQAACAAGNGALLGVQVQSGSAGLEGLQYHAAYMVFYSLGFSLGDYEQALGRLDREGQERHVQYVHLIAKATVDEKVYRALRNKKHVVRSVLGDERSDMVRRVK